MLPGKAIIIIGNLRTVEIGEVGTNARRREISVSIDGAIYFFTIEFAIFNNPIPKIQKDTI